MNRAADDGASGGAAIWGVLHDRARRDADRAIEALAGAQSERERLRHSRSRVQAMLREYGAGLQRLQGAAHAIAEAVNHRDFLGHLRRLDERVARQMLQSDQRVAQLRDEVVRTEREVAKFAKLVERAERDRRGLAALREQRQLDEWGVLQAGLKAALSEDDAVRREAL